MGRPFCLAAAAAAVVFPLAATATAAATGHIAAVVAAAAEQDQQNDNPQAVVPTEAVVIHKITSEMIVADRSAHSMVFRAGILVTEPAKK